VKLENHFNKGGSSQFRDIVEVITFDFMEQLEDLLKDKSLFGYINNLVVNRDTEHPKSK
jgi:hypothetical protein